MVDLCENFHVFSIRGRPGWKLGTLGQGDREGSVISCQAEAPSGVGCWEDLHSQQGVAKVTNQPNRATSKVRAASPNGPENFKRPHSPHRPLNTGAVPKATTSTSTSTSAVERSRTRSKMGFSGGRQFSSSSGSNSHVRRSSSSWQAGQGWAIPCV